MLVSDFDYNLPDSLIAQKPIKPRDHAKLLILDKKSNKFGHEYFYDLPKYLKKGDLLVFNNTKVFKARLLGKIKDERNIESRIEIFLLRPINKNDWEILAKPGKKLQQGVIVMFGKKLQCEFISKDDEGVTVVKFNKSSKEVLKIVEKIGHVPIPPYITNEPKKAEDYQTIYAKHVGSVAAPTAGFHFTKPLINKIKKMGVGVEFVTLHVGLGTFRTVKTEKVEDHKMHSEWVEISKKTASVINKTKQEGRRVIAVGTTTARTLEGVASLEESTKELKPFSGGINIFITPGFEFKIVDGLITNFHLPKSTLLMLVSAMAGREKILVAYKEAIKKKYKFFSFGDAMFIF